MKFQISHKISIHFFFAENFKKCVLGTVQNVVKNVEEGVTSHLEATDKVNEVSAKMEQLQVAFQHRDHNLGYLQEMKEQQIVQR